MKKQVGRLTDPMQKPPKSRRLNGKFVFIVFVMNAMQAHLKSQPYALASIVPALRVTAAARFANRHDAQGLDGCQGVMVDFLIEEPLAFLEEVVPRRVGVVGVGSCHGLCGESTAKGQQRIDQDWRAVSVPSVLEIVEKVFLAEGRKGWVFPAKVQRQQMLDQVHVIGDAGPGPWRRLRFVERR